MAILIGVTALCWLVAILWLPALRRISNQRFRIAIGWLSITSLALAVTFQVLATAYDRQIHLVMWYLAYVTFALSLYFADAVAHVSFRRRDTILLIVTLLALTLEYSFFVSRLAYVPNHNTPRTTGELLFMLTLLLYLLVMSISLFRYYFSGFFIETAPPARFRYAAMTIMWVGALGYGLVKAYMALIGYFVAPEIIPIVMLVHNLTMLVAGTAWVVALLPNKVLMPLTLTAPVTIPLKLLAFFQLRPLILALQKLELDTPTLPPQPASFFDLLTNIEFHLYRSIIYILDAKYLLSDLGNQEDTEMDRWVKILQSVNDWQDYWLLVHGYGRLPGRPKG